MIAILYTESDKGYGDRLIWVRDIFVQGNNLVAGTMEQLGISRVVHRCNSSEEANALLLDIFNEVSKGSLVYRLTQKGVTT